MGRSTVSCPRDILRLNHQQVHNLLIRFSRFFGSQKKLDQGKSIELSRNYIQISDGTGSKQGHFLENRRGLFSL